MSKERTQDTHAKSQPKSPWGTILEHGNQYDERLREKWTEEMNNLLIIAGLLSAVITPFAVESYKALTENPEDKSVQLLTQIASQLSSFTFTPGFANSTVPISSPDPFVQSETIIRLNLLWMVSLTLSLVSAAFIITVQQWLRRITPPQHLSIRDAIYLRQQRYDALLAWQVPNIINILPLLIQAAVTLFIAGLIVLLYPLNVTVGNAVASVGGIALLLFLAATLSPLVYDRCPYKSPLIPTTTAGLRWLVAVLVSFWKFMGKTTSETFETLHCTRVGWLADALVVSWKFISNLVLAFFDFLHFTVPGWRQLKNVIWSVTPHLDISGYNRMWVDRELEALQGEKPESADIPAVAWGLEMLRQDRSTLTDALSRRSWAWRRRCLLQVMTNATGYPLSSTSARAEETLIKRLRFLVHGKTSAIGMFVLRVHAGIFNYVLPTRHEWAEVCSADADTFTEELLLMLRAAFVAEERSTDRRRQQRPTMIKALLDFRMTVEAWSTLDSPDKTVPPLQKMRQLPITLLCLHLKDDDMDKLAVQESFDMLALIWEDLQFTTERSNEDKMQVLAAAAVAWLILASLPRGTQSFDDWISRRAWELHVRCEPVLDKLMSGGAERRIATNSRISYNDPFSVIPAAFNRIHQSLKRLIDSRRIPTSLQVALRSKRQNLAHSEYHDTANEYRDAASGDHPTSSDDSDTLGKTSDATKEGPIFYESNYAPVDLASQNLTLQSRNPNVDKALNVFDAIHADFSLTSKQLGVELDEMCTYLDQVYGITSDNCDHGVDASLPLGWKDRCTANGLWFQLMRVYTKQPHLFPHLTERLALDLKQILNHPWPDLPLDTASARYIMRIIAFCAVIAHVSEDMACVECLHPLFPDLLMNDSSLPSLRYELFDLRINFLTSSRLRQRINQYDVAGEDLLSVLQAADLAMSTLEYVDHESQHLFPVANCDLFNIIHAKVLLVSWLLGVRSKTMCDHLDKLYDISDGDIDASLPPTWRDKLQDDDSGFWSTFREFHSSQPYLLPRLAKKLAQYIKQLFDQLWPNLPLNEESARFTMRIVALCVVITDLCEGPGEPTAREHLELVFPQLLSSGLPSLHSQLSRYRNSLLASSDLSLASQRVGYVQNNASDLQEPVDLAGSTAKLHHLAQSTSVLVDLVSPNPLAGRDCNTVICDVLITPCLLGMRSKSTREHYVDQLYDITYDSGRGIDASFPPNWIERHTDNELWRQLRDIHSKQPHLLPPVSQRLAQDLIEQLLNRPSPDLPLDEVSTRYIMRIITLCAAIAHVNEDAACIQPLNPVFPQLPMTLGLPSLRFELFRIRFSLLSSLPSYQKHADHSSVHGAAQEGSLAILRGLFDEIATLPQFLDRILSLSDVIATGECGEILLRCLEYLSIIPLNDWKEYIHAKRELEPPMSLMSTLHLCRMVCHPIDWKGSGDVAPVWCTICEDLTFLIDKALLNNVETQDAHAQIALDILRDLDDPLRDGIAKYRFRMVMGASARDSGQLKREDEQYTLWKEQFKGSQSWYSDDLFRQLLKVAGTGRTFDRDGFMLWRIKLLPGTT